MSFEAIVHQHTSRTGGVPVNAYLVETARGVVAVDATLTVSGGTELRARVSALGKPLLAVLLTHPHPDHYGGLGELVAGEEVPIVATHGVDRVARRDDALKEQILRPMFGDEWPATRTFPNQRVADGDQVTFDGVSFTVHDLGPGESPHDSMWVLGPAGDRIFAADQVYDHMHCYLADGFGEEWLGHIGRLRASVRRDATLYIGHGGPVTPEVFDWQERYITTFLEAVRGAADLEAAERQQQVIRTMTTLLPSADLRFLMELSIEPAAVAMSAGAIAEGA